MIRGLVLDVDDTLYLERDYVRSGFDAVGAWCVLELGIEGVAGRAWQRFVDGERGTTISGALADCGAEVSEQVLSACVATYRLHIPSIQLLPDAAAMLLGVGSELRLAVVTDGPAASQSAKVEKLGLPAMVDRVVITSLMGTSKPDPAVFVAAAQEWDFLPHEIAYVADNPKKDFIGPESLGWRSFRIRRDGGLHHAEPTPNGVIEAPGFDSGEFASFLGGDQPVKP